MALTASTTQAMKPGAQAKTPPTPRAMPGISNGLIFSSASRVALSTTMTTASTADSPVDFGGALTGSGAKFNESFDGRQPYHNINKITAHDGFTMYDLLSYNQKRNGIGPLNPLGTDPYSGDDGSNYSRDWGFNENLKRQNFRNLITLLMVANGTPMLLGGDEWMRTQFGNNNAYSSGAQTTSTTGTDGVSGSQTLMPTACTTSRAR
jgi:hypothetical protein